MKNIFENASFGKAYKTRDGRKAIFHNRKLAREVGKGLIERFHLICDKVDYELSCFKDGKTSSFCENPEDIISEW